MMEFEALAYAAAAAAAANYNTCIRRVISFLTWTPRTIPLAPDAMNSFSDKWEASLIPSARPLRVSG